MLSKHKNLKSEEVIFIEDRLKNIKSAQSLGIQCIQFVDKTNEREQIDGVPVAHTTKQLIKELRKMGIR